MQQSQLYVTLHMIASAVLGCPFATHYCSVYAALNWSSLNVRWHIHWFQCTFKFICFNYPPYFKQYLVLCSSNYHVRHSAQLYFSVPLLPPKKLVVKEVLSLKLQQTGIIFPLISDVFLYLVWLSTH